LQSAYHWQFSLQAASPETFGYVLYLPSRIHVDGVALNEEYDTSAHLISEKNLKIKIYKTVILPVVLYGCETWSVTLREEHKLIVFENRVLRRIFGPKREKDGSWRKLYNDELHSLYSSPNIVRVIKSRMMRWAGRMALMETEMFTGF
jgi:hypothetical protein